ncbi:MAG: 16S rRNA (cytosine(967)-C(5))-methyltransferase RsmB [Deltaproteobacteria bacterium]|nr:16S rRNA (cytosine(967)-C(5))-methyltransferase RsmB [Deltaproteobacteria bacterium]
MTPRDLALAALNRTDDSPGFFERYVEAAFEKGSGLDERDRAFVVHLVQGVLRWRIRLDWIIQQNVRFSFKKIEPATLNILRLALYQIYFMDRVPDRAAVDEAVKQAGGPVNRHVAGFVNGILRHICRERAAIRFPDPVGDRDRYLSVYYSYPLWLVRKWIRELGPQATEHLLEAGNRIPDRVVRVNTLKIDQEGLISRLNHEGVSATRCAYSPEALRITDCKGPLTRLKAFREGLFQVQGEAAQICSHLLGVREGDMVLDVCAGLGGKSTHLAALMKNRGRVVALDRQPGRLMDLMESAGRLGTEIVLPVAADAAGALSAWITASFDRILVDGPCSGLGVISRHPDIKLTKKKTDIQRLAMLQKVILNQAIRLLKPGGRLLYTTCTISREENEEVAEGITRENRGVVRGDLKKIMPPWGVDLMDDDGFFRTFPHVHGMEGFFGALFQKSKI